jgi:hypothetical protein
VTSRVIAATAQGIPAVTAGAWHSAMARHGPPGRQLGAAAVAMLCVLLAACSPAHRPVAAPSGPAAHGDHATPPADRPLRAGERFVTVAMGRPYAPAAPAGGTDEYRCFLVDPGLTAPAFLTGSRFRPQNAALVHHAIFFRVSPAQAAVAAAADADRPGEGWTCFGDAGIPGDAAWVAHWAPGVGETLLGPGVGYPMPPGSRLVMQVHYNLLGAAAGATDRSAVRLRFTDRADLTPLETMLLPAPVELPCADGETGPLCDRAAAVRDVARRFGEPSARVADRLLRGCGGGGPPRPGEVQSCDHPVPAAGTVYAVGGHMHLLGRSVTVRLEPTGRTLLDVGEYDFDAQAVVPLPEPVAVRPGDTLRVTCTHDAALRRRLPQLRYQPPRYVVWGEGTADEMCLGLVVWSRSR